ncbi:MAG: UbiD family decarboxylase [Methanobacteriaceae archaeon]|nr:UbiD family decarboxylase [Methanobacteriaceae archaeon]MDP2836261.1 UbiD family decarboxylase [Methanobacteriaceae archaeon]MDP3033708.1 UbiD family decarboxylase [Methanobacteriaceae archaeon]MDP3484938.1 UbiD family decarboxylase [Methanobacteriaceae archaeon]MDP3624052.1 UbiD family decarboxylase [Methanobacteriaceae archaeon]
MKEFLKIIEKDFGVVKIDNEVSSVFEAAKILREHPKEAVMLENVKESDIPVISGICNTRDKIARALNTDVAGITHRIIQGMETPKAVQNIGKISENYNTSPANLRKLPIITHYQRDGGPYITAGVIFARDPENGTRNASIHRMLVLDNNNLTVRIVPRHLYTYHQRAEALGKDLDIAIAIGMNPATLLATTTSIPITADEMEVANSFHNGNMKLVKCENSDLEVPEAEIILEGKLLANKRADEGPFVDLTDTYDVVRQEPVIKLDKMHIKDDAMYHAILPAGFEHRLLQGLPQEPRIYKAVQNTVPTVQNVVLTEGGCCWLHAAVSIQKQTPGDGKNVMMAALAAHPSLKHVVVVDEDIDIFDPEDLEYAMAARVKGDDDILIVPKARGSSLDPAALPDGTTTKVGVDATKPLDKKEKFERVSLSE